MQSEEKGMNIFEGISFCSSHSRMLKQVAWQVCGNSILETPKTWLALAKLTYVAPALRWG